jgi:hypothetical protein
MVDGTNLFGYVRANPVKLNDPNGKAAQALVVAALAVAGGLYAARFLLEIRSQNKEIAREWNAAQNEYNEQVRQIEASGDAYCGGDNQTYADALQRRTETEDRLNGRVNELNDTIRDAMIVTAASLGAAAGTGRSGAQTGNTGATAVRGADIKGIAPKTETGRTALASKPTTPEPVEAANLAGKQNSVPSLAEKALGGRQGIIQAGRGISAKALAPVQKFSDYIFKEGATHGKAAVFRRLGYSKDHSEQLAQMWREQAATKYAKGEYTLGKLDQYGQRINIEIEVPGIGNSTGKTSYMESGWMIQPDGSITLNTPFSGFTR